MFVDAGRALSTARAHHTSLVVGNSLYVLGGTVGSTPSAFIERATISADDSLSAFADAGASLDRPRTSMTSALVGDRVYVIGGMATRPPAITDFDPSLASALVRPDGSLANFSTLTGVELMVPRASHASQVMGDQLYVFGGAKVSGPTGAYATTVERATLLPDGSLTAFVDAGFLLGHRRAGASSVMIDNQLYAVGGNLDPAGTLELATCNASGALDSFSAIPNSSSGTGRNTFVPLVAGRYVYLVGGANDHAYFSTSERASVGADGSLSSFAAVSVAELSIPRWAASGAVIHGFLYVIGGQDKTTAATGRVERATISADGSTVSAFKLVTSTLKLPRWGHTSVVLGNSLYVAGGYSPTNSDVGATVERATIQPDGSLSDFEVLSGVRLGIPRTGHSSAVTGDLLWMVGGLGGNDAGDLTDAERALFDPDGALYTFGLGKGTTLDFPRVGHAGAIIGRSLYVLGGYLHGTGPLDSIERADIGVDGSWGPFVPAPNGALVFLRSGHAVFTLGNWAYVVGGPEDNERASLR
jgi:hypothetical protein